MSEFIHNVQVRIKDSSRGAMVFSLRCVSGLFLGLTLSLAVEEAFQTGTFAFWFTILLVTGIFLKLTQKWSAVGVLLFDLICVLMGMLLRMYILMAPGQ